MRKNASNIDEISSINYYELFAKVLMKMAVKAARIRKSGEIERDIFYINNLSQNKFLNRFYT